MTGIETSRQGADLSTMAKTNSDTDEPLAQIAEGLKEGLSFTVSARDMETFRELSGDDNPLHFDADFAHARGFEGPLVYGALMVAAISRLLGTKLPGPGCVWHSLKIDFRKPLYVDQTATLAGVVSYCNASLGLLRVTLEVSSGGELLAKGEAQASLARPVS